MENHFYHIRWAPLSVTIFITHVCILRNGSYADVSYIKNSASPAIKQYEPWLERVAWPSSMLFLI